MEILIKAAFMRQENHILEILAWLTFFTHCITDNIGIIAGFTSFTLSLTGIILNIIKIKKENKK